jgi:hypothetical protein
MPLIRFSSFSFPSSLFTPSALASRRVLFSGCLAGLAACSIHSGEMPKADGAASSSADGGASAEAAPEADAGTDAGANVITEKGVMIDYETLSPIPGLTFTDNGVSTTTDAKGAFSLSVPSTVTSIAGTVTGPGYSTLLFPTVAPSLDGGIDFGTNVMGDTNTFGLEQSVLQNDQTTAIVQIVAQVTGACASAAGGTLQVLSPAGASVEYFSTLNLPNPSLTSFAAVAAPRPVAVVYNIAPGAVLTVAVVHPTCALVPFPTMAVSGVQELTGEVRTVATEPGDVNAALVLVLQ